MVWYDFIWYGMNFHMVWYYYDLMCNDVIWFDIVWLCYGIKYDMIWDDMIWYDMIWYDMIWYDMIWYDMIWYDMIWYDWYDLIFKSMWVSMHGTHFNPCIPEGFSPAYFPKGGCCNPLRIINTEGHINLNLLPVYRYGHPLSIDTKISTKLLRMTSLWRHNVSMPSKIEKWSFCVLIYRRKLILRKTS